MSKTNIAISLVLDLLWIAFLFLFFPVFTLNPNYVYILPFWIASIILTFILLIVEEDSSTAKGIIVVNLLLLVGVVIAMWLLYSALDLFMCITTTLGITISLLSSYIRISGGFKLLFTLLSSFIGFILFFYVIPGNIIDYRNITLACLFIPFTLMFIIALLIENTFESAFWVLWIVGFILNIIYIVLLFIFYPGMTMQIIALLVLSIISEIAGSLRSQD